jgi:hypothetical protein
MKTISYEQQEELAGFFLHLWNIYHGESENRLGFWQARLDEIGISWSVQNSVSALARTRSNGFLYFRTILKSKNIIVQTRIN